MFLRNYWYVAAMPQELENGALLGRWILDEPVLIYRTADGEITAMRDICPHRSARLSAGERDGDTVRCLYHGPELARRHMSSGSGPRRHSTERAARSIIPRCGKMAADLDMDGRPRARG